MITGVISADVSAQEAIRAVIKKCETMEDVKISVIRNKDKATKKVTQVITDVSFKNNEALSKEILAAFEKDKDKSDQEIEEWAGGRLKEMLYRFGYSYYTFSQKEDGSCTLTAVESEK